MVLTLKKVHQPAGRNYNIVVRNHLDKFMAFCAPHDAAFVEVGRWLDQWDKCTEINITSAHGRAAAVQLEDSEWRLIVSGTIHGGRKVIEVGGSRDFDIRFTADGQMVLECLDGYTWGEETGSVLVFELVPFRV